MLAAASFIESTIAEATLNGASAVRTADFDGDGDIDIVVAAERAGHLAWFENTDGNGNFGPQQIIDADASILSIELGDLDGDGDIDVAAGLYERDEVVWYSNTGGGFAAARSLGTLAGPRDIALSDIDNDGDLDLLAAVIDTEQVGYFLNDGTGRFSDFNLVGVVPQVIHVAAADLDGDSELEIYAGGDSAELHRFDRVNDVFELTFAFDYPSTSTAAGDPDGDGIDALYLANEALGGIFQTGDGYSILNGFDISTVWTPTNLAAEFGSDIGSALIHIADMNGDDRSDVVVGSASAGVIYWHQGNVGTWIATGLRVLSDLDVADFNGDGRLDVVAASAFDDRVGWYENLGNEFAEEILLDDAGVQGSFQVEVLDVDVDGDLDIAALAKYDREIVWYENVQGSFGERQTLVEEIEAFASLEAADMNADGRTDLLAGPTGGQPDRFGIESNVAIWTNSPEPSDADLILTGYNSRILTGDINGDGALDFVVTDPSTPTVVEVQWYSRNASGDYEPHLIETDAFIDASSFELTDIDGDNDLDLLAALVRFDPETEIDSRVVWYPNDGTGTFGAARLITTEASGVRSLHSADIDGDGDKDVAMSVIYESGIVWYENVDGQGGFAPQANVVSAQIDLVRVLRSHDIDGDGDFDLIALAAYDDTVNLFENDGTGQFGDRVVVSEAPHGIADLEAADFDDDGDLDLIVASSVDSAIRYFQNETELPASPGDFTRDGQLTAEDIDLFCRAMRSQSDAPVFDLNADNALDRFDLDELILRIFDSTYGDANLDGKFDSADLVAVFTVGEYEDQITLNSTWATGDWTCDGEFSSSDLVASFQAGGFEQPAGVIRIVHPSRVLDPFGATREEGQRSAVPHPGGAVYADAQPRWLPQLETWKCLFEEDDGERNAILGENEDDGEGQEDLQ